jgi:hypothetical protein
MVQSQPIIPINRSARPRSVGLRTATHTSSPAAKTTPLDCTSTAPDTTTRPCSVSFRKIRLVFAVGMRISTDMPMEILLASSTRLDSQAALGRCSQGQAGVNQVLQGLNQSNTGTEITIDTPSGRTRLDIGSYDPESGELNLIEVKNGPGARLTSNQRACFPDIQNGNFTPAGQNAAGLGLSLEPGGGVSSVNVNVVNLKWGRRANA